MKTIRERAYEYIQRGWKIYPIFNPKKDGRCSCGKLNCKNVGKHPRESAWKEKQYNEQSINDALEKWPDTNIGIATGAASGFFVLDIDPRNGGDESLELLVQEYGPLPKTLTVKTGSGTHYYFRCDDRTIKSTKIGRSGIDVQGDGRGVTAAGSLHANGNRYEFVDEPVEIALPPDWLIKLITESIETSGYEKDRSQAKAIVDLILKRPDVELFYDQYEVPQARIPNRKERFSTVAGIKSKAFQKFTNYVAFTQMGFIPSRCVLDQVIGTLEAIALYERDENTLDCRVGRRNGAIYYDLDQAVIKVTESGWCIDPNPPCLFRHYSGNLPQVEPLAGGSIEKFLEFVNIKSDADKLLLLVVIVAAFIPDIPHLILVIHGPQGSAKTSLTRFLIRLIDPHAAMDVPHLNAMEFMQAASHRWLLSMDNLQSLPVAVSDTLCKLATGAAFQKRELYTVDDDFIRKMHRQIILNGIGNPAWKPDIIDRSCFLELDRIREESRRDETTINKEFEALLPYLLGSVFDILSKAMKIHPTIKLSKMPRMADFAIWGCAITEAMGRDHKEFLDAYEANVKRQTDEALDASIVACAIRHYLKSKKVLEGSASIILRELKDIADEAGIEEYQLPKSPYSMGHKLKEIKPVLEAHGFIVDFERGTGRLWRITRPITKKSAMANVSVQPIANVVSSEIPSGIYSSYIEKDALANIEKCREHDVDIPMNAPGCFADKEQLDKKPGCVICNCNLKCLRAVQQIYGQEVFSTPHTASVGAP